MTDDEIAAAMRVKFEEFINMRNGFHDHYCPQCRYGYVCPKITHCNDPLNMPCLKHRECDDVAFDDLPKELKDRLPRI